MKNIEIKVRVTDRLQMMRSIRKLGGKKVGVLRQTDTYFDVPNGRLKLREETSRETADLIFYSRPNSKISRLSEYDIQNISKVDTKKMKSILMKALSVRVIVKKVRILYLFRHTRIHLDSVTGLGDFLELETVVSGLKMSDAKKEHETVIQMLGLALCDKIPVSYSDLLLASRKKT
jgi:predicted adenylyl cyclase CyaB